MSVLEVNNLKKIYTARFGANHVQALTNVTFSVEEGEYVAIMGESGSGKTTLLNILAALDKPTGGEVKLNGRSFWRKSAKKRSLLSAAIIWGLSFRISTCWIRFRLRIISFCPLCSRENLTRKWSRAPRHRRQTSDFRNSEQISLRGIRRTEAARCSCARTDNRPATYPCGRTDRCAGFQGSRRPFAPVR